MLMFEKEDLPIRADSERISAVYGWRRICLITLLFKSTLFPLMSSLLGLNKTPIGKEKGAGIFGFASIIEIDLTAKPWCRSTLMESERCGVTNCGACHSSCYCDRFPPVSGVWSATPRATASSRPGASTCGACRPARSCGLDIDAARRPDVLWHRRDGARPFEREFSAPPRQVSAHRHLECRPIRKMRARYRRLTAAARPVAPPRRGKTIRTTERAARCGMRRFDLDWMPTPPAVRRPRPGRPNQPDSAHASIAGRSRRAPNARHSHIESSRTSDTNTAAAWPRRVDPFGMARRAHGRGSDRSTAGTAFTRCPTFCRKAVYPAREGIPRTSP